MLHDGVFIFLKSDQTGMSHFEQPDLYHYVVFFKVISLNCQTKYSLAQLSLNMHPQHCLLYGETLVSVPEICIMSSLLASRYKGII